MRKSASLPCWPAARLGEALEALARAAGHPAHPEDVPNPPESLLRHDEMVGRWIESTASVLGLECERVDMPYSEIEQRLRVAGPALVRLCGEGFLALLDGGSVLGPDLSVHRVHPAAIRAALCRDIEAPLASGIDHFLDQASIPNRKRQRIRAALLRDRLGTVSLQDCWLLCLPPGGSFRQHLKRARLPRGLLAFAGAQLAEYLIWMVAWWVIGRGALQGRLDRGWLAAWVLLLVTLVPCRVAATWVQGSISIIAGGLLKERLLYGALRLEPDEIRHQGAGQLLGCVMESEALEALALSGGFLGLAAVIELILAASVLSAGAGGALSVLLLVLWTGVAALLAWRYLRCNRRWTDQRLRMTHNLVERMVGHRTRLAQEDPSLWHEGEDRELEHYLDTSSGMNHAATALFALVPRGWLMLGVLGLAPSFVAGRAAPATLAVGVGGILLGYRAMKKLLGGLSSLFGAAISWDRIAALSAAAARPQLSGAPAAAVAESPLVPGQTLLEAHHLLFRYPGRSEPVLRDCDLKISTGDRLLLDGASGSGKSTLASLLTGLRVPDSGLLLAGGLDRQTLGLNGWRRKVAAAPQFHENYVLTGPFAFNLLMGRQGRIEERDLHEAESVCLELGLGDLLQRMPAGMLQLVGETGWQLSHGERSRLYIARALLQQSELIVLDESFAALDPENLQRALTCVLKRARTVLVIAHP